MFKRARKPVFRVSYDGPEARFRVEVLADREVRVHRGMRVGEVINLVRLERPERVYMDRLPESRMYAIVADTFPTAVVPA